MTENENMVVEQQAPPEQGKKNRMANFKAGFKEWGRKQIVNLKRRPSNIALVFFVITSLVYMIAYSTVAEMLYGGRENPVIEWSALCSFVVFLFSILILVLYLQAFPKRKKPNVVMLVLVGLFAAVMIAMDIICYLELQDVFAAATRPLTPEYYASENIFLAHIVLVALSSVVLACTPLIKMGLMKINTRKEVEATVSEMSGPLELEDAD